MTVVTLHVESLIIKYVRFILNRSRIFFLYDFNCFGASSNPTDCS